MIIIGSWSRIVVLFGSVLSGPVRCGAMECRCRPGSNASTMPASEDRRDGAPLVEEASRAHGRIGRTKERSCLSHLQINWCDRLISVVQSTAATRRSAGQLTWAAPRPRLSDAADSAWRISRAVVCLLLPDEHANCLSRRLSIIVVIIIIIIILIITLIITLGRARRSHRPTHRLANPPTERLRERESFVADHQPQHFLFHAASAAELEAHKEFHRRS